MTPDSVRDPTTSEERNLGRVSETKRVRYRHTDLDREINEKKSREEERVTETVRLGDRGREVLGIGTFYQMVK